MLPETCTCNIVPEVLLQHHNLKCTGCVVAAWCSVKVLHLKFTGEMMQSWTSCHQSDHPREHNSTQTVRMDGEGRLCCQNSCFTVHLSCFCTCYPMPECGSTSLFFLIFCLQHLHSVEVKKGHKSPCPCVSMRACCACLLHALWDAARSWHSEWMEVIIYDTVHLSPCVVSPRPVSCHRMEW